MVLPRRCNPPNSILHPRPPLSSLSMAIRQRSRLPRRRSRHSPSFGNQLRILGPCRVHLQLLHPPIPLPVVDAIQLHPLCGPRRWNSVRHHSHLPLPTTSQGRCYTKLVGKHRLAKHCRRHGPASQDTKSWRNIRTVDLVIKDQASVPFFPWIFRFRST